MLILPIYDRIDRLDRQMEKVIQCPICNDIDHCFEDNQGDYNSFMCFKCGYMSDTRFNKEHDTKANQNTAVLINQIKQWDNDREIYWYPSVVNMGKLGMIFPNGDQNDWKWNFAKVKPVKEHTEATKGYDNFLDIDNADEYEKDDFISAIRDMGITKDLNNAKN